MKLKLFFLACTLTLQAHGMQRFFNLAHTTFAQAKVFAHKPLSLNRANMGKIRALSAAVLSGILIKQNNTTELNSSVKTNRVGWCGFSAENDDVKIVSEEPYKGNSMECKRPGHTCTFKMSPPAIYSHLEAGKDIKEIYTITPKIKSKHTITRQDENIKISCSKYENNITGQDNTKCEALCKALGSVCMLNTQDSQTLFEQMNSEKNFKSLYSLAKKQS